MARINLWTYDVKTGAIYVGAKMVACTLDGTGKPWANDPAQAFRFGQMIVNKMNEVDTKTKHRKPLGRSREAK